jgi:hypothetical protein
MPQHLQIKSRNRGQTATNLSQQPQCSGRTVLDVGGERGASFRQVRAAAAADRENGK